MWKQTEIIIISLAALMFAVGVGLDIGLQEHVLGQIAFLAATCTVGYSIIKKGLYGVIRSHRLDMNILITIAAAGAFAIGHGEEGATVMLLFRVAEFLEDYASDRARHEVGALLKLTPETAVVLRNGSEVVVHTHEVAVGEEVVVKPGEKIPLDGIVIRGQSSVNQAAPTGESVPVVKKVDDTMFAGTLNVEGYLELRVLKKSDETRVSRIVQLVDEAQRKKTPTEAFIDRFSHYYTPTVIALAALITVPPPLIFGLPIDEWFYKGLVLLVISCPCAMAISTPVSIVSGLTTAAKRGILIKGGDVIEKLKDTRVVVFDKTGTLTEGRPAVTDVIGLNGTTEREVVQIAASLGVKSTHPVSEAIAQKATEADVTLMPVTDFKSVPGKGLTGRLNGVEFFAGNRSLSNDVNSHPLNDVFDRLENEGKTLVVIGTVTRFSGVIGLKDRPRDKSAATVSALASRGIKTVMLTGDNERAAALFRASFASMSAMLSFCLMTKCDTSKS